MIRTYHHTAKYQSIRDVIIQTLSHLTDIYDLAKVYDSHKYDELDISLTTYIKDKLEEELKKHTGNELLNIYESKQIGKHTREMVWTILQTRF